MWMLVGMLTVLTGCPPTNNEDSNSTSPQEDMTSSPDDMGELPGDMGEQPDPDMGMMPGEDMGGMPDMEQPPEDMNNTGVDATCFVEHIAPGTLPIDAQPGPLSWVLSCNAPLSAEQLGERLEVARQRGESLSQALSVDGVVCEEREDAWRCQITTSGLDAPPEPYETAIGPESLSFKDTTGQMFEGRVRWHLSDAKLATIQDTFDDVPLPVGYAERGLGVQKLAVESGFVLFGAMVNAAGDGVEIFDVDLLSSTPSVRVHETIEVSMGEVTTSDFQVRLVDNEVQVTWWGFNSATGQFKGQVSKFGQDASFQDSYTLDENAYTGPKLARILDTQLGTQETSTGNKLGVRVVGVTETNTLVVVRVFAGDSSNQVTLTRQLDSLDGVLPSELDSTNFGILETPGVLPNLDANVGRSYVASANGIGWISLDGISFATRLVLTSVQWPFKLELKLAPSGEMIGFASPEAGDDSLFMVGADADGKPSSVTSLQMPSGVDFGDSGLSGAHIEADTLTMFGRWPWNWRDKFKAVGKPDGSMMVAQWNVKPAGAGMSYPLTSVRPMVVTDEAVMASSGDLSIQSVTEDGALRTIPVAAVIGDCTSPEACAVQISNRTPNGFSMMMVPGTNGATMAIDKYGDILIDGVPLEFDLIGNPWTFDKPGDGNGAIILGTVDAAMATHAIWEIADDGTIKGSGLLNFTTKEGTPALDADVLISAGAIADYAAGADPSAVTLHYGATRTVRDPKGAVVGTEDLRGALPLAKLLDATNSRSPVTVDLSNSPPEVIASGDASVFLAPPVNAPFASSDLSRQYAERGDDVVIATLTAEQAEFPVEVRITGGKVQVVASNKDGTTTLIEETEAATISVDNPTFVAPDGASSNILSKSGSPRFTGKIKRIRIKKRNVGSNFKVKGPASLEENIEGVDVVYEVVLETREVSPSGLGEHAYIQDVGDFNGDGVPDIAVVVGTRDDADLSGANTSLYFGDGLTGYMMAPFPLTGGPSVSWPPVQQAVAGNGKGTRKAASQIQQMQIPLL
jgi:hypothetical protein